MQIIGIVDSASPELRGDELSAFYGALATAGVDGKSAKVLYAWADNDYARLDEIAREMVEAKVAVIVAAGGPVSALAAQRATRGTEMPVVFTAVTDPIASGLVSDLKVPGGNLTGTRGNTSELDLRRMQILDEVLGKKQGAIAVLANPNRPFPTKADFAAQTKVLQAKAKKAGRSAVVLGAGSKAEIANAFKTLQGLVKKREVVGLVVTADPFLANSREQIVPLANRLGIPAIYQWPSFVVDGGLMSFAPSKAQAYANAGDFVADILSGKPVGTLAVREARKFEVAVNQETARKLKFKIPKKLGGQAVRVIVKP
jgi:putative ABC transport system substrate-binding protein